MPCAVCDNDVNALRLCDACRADPANAGWSEGEPRELPQLAVDAAPGRRLADLGARPLRPVHERTRQILQLVMVATIRTLVRPRGRRRYRDEWTWDSRPLSFEEVGWLVGCSRQAVRRVVRRALEKK